MCEVRITKTIACFTELAWDNVVWLFYIGFEKLLPWKEALDKNQIKLWREEIRDLHKHHKGQEGTSDKTCISVMNHWCLCWHKIKDVKLLATLCIG
jgi:hypothetical protein